MLVACASACLISIFVRAANAIDSLSSKFIGGGVSVLCRGGVMVTDGEKTPDIMSLKVKVGPYVTFNDSMPTTHTIPGADARAGRTSEGSMAAEETRTCRGRSLMAATLRPDEAQ